MSLLLWYPFTQDGYNRGAIEGNHLSPTMNNTGLLGKCGLANKVLLSTNVDIGGTYNPLNNNLTMTCWIKFNFNECATVIDNIAWSSFASNKTTPTGGIAGSMSYNTTGIVWTANNIYNGGTRADFSQINVFGYTRGNAQITTSSARITFGKWTHLALTLNKDTKLMKFYVNGVLIGTAKSYASITGYTANRTFGLNQQQVYGGNGPSVRLPIYYNDVRLYDEELSIKEIQELSKGLMVHYTFNDPYSEHTTNIIHGKYQGYQSSLILQTESFNGLPIYKNIVTSPFTGTAKDNAGFCHQGPIAYTQIQSEKPFFQLSFWKRLNQSYGVNIGGYIYVTYTDGTKGQHSWVYNKSNWGTDINSIGKWEFITARATLNSGKTVQEITRFYVYGRNATGGDCDFAGIQLEAKDHPTPFTTGSRDNLLSDESGYGNDGTMNKIDFSLTTNCGSFSSSFNGTHSYIELPNWKPSLPNEPYTIAFWIKPEEDKTRDIYFGNHANSSETFNIERTAANYLRVYYASDTPIGVISAITIPVNTWVHIVTTFDGTTFKAYKDGVEKYSKALTKTLNCTNAKWKIGSDYRTAVGTSEATRYKGLMSDFRIYASALTSDQVLELYESKAEIDKNQNIFTNEIIEQNETANMVNLGSWEQGGVQDANGADANNMNNRVRTKYIPVLPNTPYYFQAATGWDIRGVHFYRKDNTWISYTTVGNAGVRTTPEDCYYARFIIQNDNASLDALVANIATFGPVMVPGNTATTSDMAADTDVQVTKTYQIKTKDICENHDVGFFKDGTASGNRFYEI